MKVFKFSFCSLFLFFFYFFKKHFLIIFWKFEQTPASTRFDSQPSDHLLHVVLLSVLFPVTLSALSLLKEQKCPGRYVQNKLLS